MNEVILAQLNSTQRDAVTYCDGAELVIAGAGSGKTRVLTYKIAYLLESGYQPWNILALTFTNKAANEMKARISDLVGHDKARFLNMGTFHSIFSRILRVEASTIGYNSNFTIYDQTDSRALIKNIIKEMGLDEKQYSHTSISDRISMIKNHLITPQMYMTSENANIDAQRRTPEIKNIYKKYVARCKQANVMDFDDLLLNTYLLFSSNEEIRRKYVEKFRYILVDEYQDTNSAQQRIIMQLTSEHQHICAVGDDAQSIYGFRGANIDNILNFTNTYQNTRLFKLEQNYRSTQMIVQAANSLIKHNERQIPKNVFSANESGEKIHFIQSYSDKEEAAILCKTIRKIKARENYSYNDFAVLYRTNSQSRCIEEELRRNNIPYHIYGGLSFYQRKEIKDIIAYFRIVANPYDEEALRRVINYPMRGIGTTTLSKISSGANDNNVNLWTAIKQPQTFGIQLNNGTIAKLANFCSMVEAWRAELQDSNAYELGQKIIIESGINKELNGKNSAEDMARRENVVEFLAGMQDFVESRREQGLNVYLPDFLQEVALMSDTVTNTDTEDDDNISLMTIHSAKGLEFQVVFIVGLEENILPSPLSCNNPRELEEERRLLYVAITRAKKYCFMSCAQSRFRYGRMEFSSPSRFIKDIDPAFIIVDNIGNNSHTYKSSTSDFYKYTKEQNSSSANTILNFERRPHIIYDKGVSTEKQTSDTISEKTQLTRRLKLKPVNNIINKDILTEKSSGVDIRIGDIIEHQRFGIGTITMLCGTGDNLKATVKFNATGEKQLLLKFAKYRIINRQ